MLKAAHCSMWGVIANYALLMLFLFLNTFVCAQAVRNQQVTAPQTWAKKTTVFFAL